MFKRLMSKCLASKTNLKQEKNNVYKQVYSSVCYSKE